MIIVADTGPIIHLHWIGASAWALPPFPIHVVEEVWGEILSLDRSALDDTRFVRVTADREQPKILERFHLDAGEVAALCFALSQKDRRSVLVLCDERAARAACSALSVSVTGSIGLILEAFHSGRVQRKEAERALQELPGRGRLHVDLSLVRRAVDALRNSLH